MTVYFARTQKYNLFLIDAIKMHSYEIRIYKFAVAYVLQKICIILSSMELNCFFFF